MVIRWRNTRIPQARCCKVLQKIWESKRLYATPIIFFLIDSLSKYVYFEFRKKKVVLKKNIDFYLCSNNKQLDEARSAS